MGTCNCIFSVYEDFFIIPNSVDPDRMLQDVASHLGLHCLSMYLLLVPGLGRVKIKRFKSLYVLCYFGAKYFLSFM